MKFRRGQLQALKNAVKNFWVPLLLGNLSICKNSDFPKITLPHVTLWKTKECKHIIIIIVAVVIIIVVVVVTTTTTTTTIIIIIIIIMYSVLRQVHSLSKSEFSLV
jgi:hypothetical protein